ncbi:histidine kinase [Frankia sp. AgB32]|uniref:sensor histidine kinase n=1 Tax=Frankia sp. AgB32 TaxID=631119 RepID=UPI00201027B7|nr:histidine kinase [Frankia sp. AgB32]MCK9894804.1 histidine kinase [Frankia sp. AgB32]
MPSLSGSYRQRVPLPAAPPAERRGATSAQIDNPSVRYATTAVLILVAAPVVPSGLTGARATVTVALLVVNCVVLASRHLPASVLPARPRIALLVVGAAAAAALIAVSGSGFAPMFGYCIAGHAGYRFPSDRAVPIAVLCSVLSGGVLLFQLGPAHLDIPWYVGAASGFAAPLGMVNRSRQAAITAALAASESAERAARAEAREAVLAERGRIARDVHDVLAHSLAGINMQLEMADALLEHGELDQARGATRRAQSLVRESLVEARRTVTALREDTLPLAETLTAMTRSAGHPDPPTITGQPRELDTRTAQALVRAAQEALTNAHKHAPGAPVKIILAYTPDAVDLQIVNGAPRDGHRPLADTGSGMGLVGMRERITLLGGTATAGPHTDGGPVEHLSGRGWRVCVTIPA